MSYCRIAGSWHWFILVESGKYKHGYFIPDGKISVAFSYVPHQTYEYIREKYDHKPNFKFFTQSGDDNLATLAGYNPFLITKSHVLDAWKLTDEYVVEKSQPVYHWRFHRFCEMFDSYNVFSIVPWLGVTDCIGYSNYHLKFSS